MPYMIHFSIVLLLLLQVSNHGQTAPVARQQDTAKSTKTTTVTENDLLEGDMIIDAKMMNIIANQAMDTKRSAVTNNMLWRNGVVPYTISNTLSSYAQTIIHLAFAKLRASTCIDFKPRSNEYYYVEFIKGNGCYSYVGRQLYGRQVISLGSGCESVGIALHEMVHTLGFFHTSSRTDRDSYVIVYDNNIATGMAHNFYKYSHGQIDHLNSPYDVTSIMHLPRHAFAKSSNLITIQAKAGSHIKLGQTGELSPVDKYQINSLYKCSSTTSASSCLTALGLQNRAIPDSSIRASSESSSLYVASAARLHELPSMYNMGAWCPKTNTNAWLEIDLGQTVRVTGIATQGHQGMMSDYYTPKYDLKYKKNYSFIWYSYLSTSKAYGGTKSLPGNWDGNSVQYNALSPSFTARYVRLYPKSWINRPCFRVEIYGCKI